MSTRHMTAAAQLTEPGQLYPAHISWAGAGSPLIWAERQAIIDTREYSFVGKLKTSN